MAPSALVAAFLLSTTAPTVWGEECLVKEKGYFTDLTNTHILSFLDPDSHLDLKVQFEGHEPKSQRDWVRLTNSMVKYGKVRKDMNSSVDREKPVLIHDQWNRLRLKVVDARLELTLLSGVDDEATLLELELDFPVASVHVEGTFSLCSGGSPEWEVNEGEEVSVLLQTEHTQQLQVIGRGDSKPYLKMPWGKSKPLNISANTTLSIETWRRRSVTHIEVFHLETENNKESLGDMDQPVNHPTVWIIIGSHAGTLHLRLDLSPTTAKSDSHSVDHSGGDFVLLWPMGYVLLFGGVAIGCLCGVLVTWLYTRKKARKDTAADACKKKFLPAQDQTATEKLVITVEEGRDEE